MDSENEQNATQPFYDFVGPGDFAKALISLGSIGLFNAFGAERRFSVTVSAYCQVMGFLRIPIAEKMQALW